MKKRNKLDSTYFDGIRESLIEVVDSFDKGKKLTSREVNLPEPPSEMAAEDILDLRERKLHVSQHVFAFLLNVSPKTVQAWEQNRNTPSGAALRLLWMARERPEFFRSIFLPVDATDK